MNLPPLADLIIVLDEKPESGKIDRVCHICGETYFGRNFVRCQECERRNDRIHVIHDWSN